MPDEPRSSVGPAADRRVWVATIVLSSFLLFSLELLAGRLLLPAFGGSAAVWTTALCFFTGVLLAGYVYAHLLATRLPFAAAARVHVALAAVAALAALAAATGGARVADLSLSALPEAVAVLVALGVLAGLPAFLLASTTPLLSAWYSSRRGSPWWLYAVSNGASFAALFAYPLLVQPLIALSIQRLLIGGGLAVLSGLLAWLMIRAGSPRAHAASTDPATVAERIPGRRHLVRVVAAAVPAGLLSATTNFLETDLSAAPLIWIGPLAAYLASLVIAFADSGRRILPVVDRLAPAAAALLWVPFIHPPGWPVGALVLVMVGAALVLATAIHGRLALDRPSTAQLTSFYLALAVGGFLATAFVALIAPIAFNTACEFPLLLIAAVAVLAYLRPARVPIAWRLAPFAGAALVLLLSLGRFDSRNAVEVVQLFAVAAVGLAVAVRPWVGVGVTAATLGALIVLTSAPSVIRVRSFYAVSQVRQETAAIRTLYSGTTLHGLQFGDARRREPTTYYAAVGPAGLAFEDLRARTSAGRIGSVGLGVGTLAAYARPTDEMIFYEIDQSIADIAANPDYFTFLADASSRPRIVVADGRLALEREPRASFDLLVLDAFSSDAVPAHLLTREALATYAGVLRPGGVILLNLSTRYYDLAAAVAGTARSIGLGAVERGLIPGPITTAEVGAVPSRWLVVGLPADVARFEAAGWGQLRSGIVLTDDNPDLLRTLLPGSL